MYERASGQLINFEKSSLSFSPNTNDRVKETIKSMLTIPVVQGHEVYLGLPVFSSRNKKLQFRYLVERVVTRLQGWGSKTFSSGGKETLIKSVIQSIPTYAMSCFRISTSICEEIERACANFWWGVDDGKNRMHWKSWKALCKPKCIGGLGFRHLETFNKALLTKQIWRVLQSPESLVARVLKARYYKHQDILHDSLGSNPSYIWRSLLWSRPLLEKGLYWHVRNGERIDTFASRWIPGRGVQPKPPQYSGTYDKVSSLLLNWTME
ncbi:putative mitochondrial protein AtMg00310 [Primulina tabacum]|uniref:putative mitochondrial protein AtMg00310 n=1 Tax=Primulina tabacum TaxID=48773 RepID=UPI003F5945AB